MSRTKINVSKAHTFTGHKDCIYALEKESESTFFTSGSDGLVVRWDLEKPDQGELVAQVKNTVYALCYLPASNQLVVGQNFEGIHLIDLSAKAETRSLQLENQPIFDIKHHEGKLFIGTGGGNLFVADAATFSLLHKKELSKDALRTLAVSPLNGHLATGFSDHFLRVLDLKSGQLLHEQQAHTNSVFSLTYSPNEKALLSGSRDAHLKIWDARETYALRESIVAHMYTLNAISFRPDGRYFATCSKDKSVKVWDAHSFKLLKVIDKARHAGHGTSVNKLCWMGDTSLVSASDDRSISVWQLEFLAPA